MLFQNDTEQRDHLICSEEHGHHFSLVSEFREFF